VELAEEGAVDGSPEDPASPDVELAEEGPVDGSPEDPASPDVELAEEGPVDGSPEDPASPEVELAEEGPVDGSPEDPASPEEAPGSSNEEEEPLDDELPGTPPSAGQGTVWQARSSSGLGSVHRPSSTALPVGSWQTTARVCWPSHSALHADQDPTLHV
jgi:PBP1b-binding outer membrane lipoprotein LpoB